MLLDTCALLWLVHDQTSLSDATLQKMDEALSTLSEGLRIVFVLRDIDGLSTAQTAEVLDLSETAVKSRLHRARLALRRELSPYLRDVSRER